MMPATITIPVAKQYTGSYTVFTDKSPSLPPRAEGPEFVPVSIDWFIDGGSGNCVKFDLTSVIGKFSQICGLYIDNKSVSGIQIFFPDTQFFIVVPPNTSGWYPVNTGGLIFFVLGLTSGALDQTFINIFNHPVIPSSIPSQFQQIILTPNLSLVSITGIVTENAILLPAISTNYIIKTISVGFSVSGTRPGATADFIVTFRNNASSVLLARSVVNLTFPNVGFGEVSYVLLLNMNDINLAIDTVIMEKVNNGFTVVNGALTVTILYQILP